MDMIFEFKDKEYILPCINKHFKSIYSPAYMSRIALPNQADKGFVTALNGLVRKSHSLYGGYTPESMTLPEPIQSIWKD
jgi:hypothetical protein